MADEQVPTWVKEKRNQLDQMKGCDNATNRDIGQRLRASHYRSYKTTIDSVVNGLLSRPIDGVCQRGRDKQLKTPCDADNGGKPQPPSTRIPNPLLNCTAPPQSLRPRHDTSLIGSGALPLCNHYHHVTPQSLAPSSIDSPSSLPHHRPLTTP
ncbi:hypothetical protein ACFE04_018661 [Oxalis oulophora]